MSLRRIIIIALSLMLLGLSMFGYKLVFLGFPLVPDETTEVWTVEARIAFEALPGSVKVSLEIPTLTPGFTVFEENFVSPSFGFTTLYTATGRTAQWAVRQASGPQTLYYRAVVYREKANAREDTTPTLPPVPVLDEPYNTAMQVLVDEVRAVSADAATFTSELLRLLNDPSPDQNVALFLSQVKTPTERAQAASTLLAGNRIPSRLVRGIQLLDQQRNAGIVPWLEIHDGDRWIYFDPSTGEMGLPSDFLFWWRGGQPLVHVEGGRNTDVRLAVQKNVAEAMVVAEARAARAQSRLVEFSLFSLPIQTQAVYSVLLLIPIGALVVVVSRNIIGVQTFGTFMPVLIALAFRETRLLSGVLMFMLLVALGLAIRFYLERLRLLLVPRLATVLVSVVLLMLVVSIISAKLGLEVGLSVALFPMVILTMTIERMSVVWEERGAAEAIQQGFGSLLVAGICYLVMGLDYLEHLIFVFPELLLLVLGSLLILGRYQGYRISELRRFKSFGT